MRSYFNWFLNKRPFPNKTDTSPLKAESPLSGAQGKKQSAPTKASAEALRQTRKPDSARLVHKHHPGKQPLHEGKWLLAPFLTPSFATVLELEALKIPAECFPQ